MAWQVCDYQAGDFKLKHQTTGGQKCADSLSLVPIHKNHFWRHSSWRYSDVHSFDANVIFNPLIKMLPFWMIMKPEEKEFQYPNSTQSDLTFSPIQSGKILFSVDLADLVTAKANQTTFPVADMIDKFHCGTAMIK